MPLPVVAPLRERPAPGVDLAGHLEAFGAATALLTDRGRLGYADLAGRVRATAERLGTGRLVHVGPSVLEVGAAAVASMGLAGLLAGLATAWWQRRSSEPVPEHVTD